VLTLPYDPVLALYFENEPRVEIDLTPGLYK